MKKPVSLLYTASLASFYALSGLQLSAEETKKMNVLFIISDDMRVELGAYGQSLAQTPNIDALARKGVRFERAYCQYPLCGPSRSSMLTGHTPTHTELYGNREWVGTRHPDWTTLPHHFRNQGFTTLRTGKIFHEGIDEPEAWVEGGQARIYGEGTSENSAAKPRARNSSPTDRKVSEADAKAHTANMVKADQNRAKQSDRWEAVEGELVPQQKDTLVADKALEYLRDPKRKAEPFFLACGFSKPHSPLVAPKRFFDLYKAEEIPLPVDFAARPTVPEGFPVGSIRPNNSDLFVHRDASPQEAREMIRAYLACISYVDWNVGRVLSELEKQGLQENTIVVFWSDHGYQLGEKGKWSKAGSLWERGTRVPFIIYDPRAKGNGRASPRIVQAIDIYPTITDLAGLPLPKDLDGLSLRPLVENPELEWDHPAFTVWNERNRGITGGVIRTERWRYAEFYGPGAGSMLTDPLNDPHELKNLAAQPQYADVIKELSALLRDYVKGQTEEPAQK